MNSIPFIPVLSESITINRSPFYSKEIKVNYNNDEALKILNDIITKHKKQGYKYPFISCLFLQFYNSGKKILEKDELYSLVQREVINNKNKIISSPTDRYCIINSHNYKSKIKDILKKKKFFTKTKTNDGSFEYMLNEGVVAYIIPKIISDLKVLAKNGDFYKDEIEEENEDEKNNGNKDKEKKEKNDDGENEKNEKKKKRKYRNKKDNNKKGENGKKNVDSTDNTGDNNADDFDIIIRDCNKNYEQNNVNIIDKDEIENNKNVDKDKEKQKYINKTVICNSEMSSVNNKFNTSFDLNNNNNNNNNDSNKTTLLKKKRKRRNKKKDIKIQEQQEQTNKSFYLSENYPSKNSNNEKIDKNPNLTKAKNIKEDNPLLSLNNPLKENILSLNNKIDSISNIGEIFLNFINNKNISDITTKKFNLVKEKIELKKKSIKADCLFLKKLTKSQKKLNTLKLSEIQQKIKLMKTYYNQYNELIELLLKDKNAIENSKNKDEAKKILGIYKTNYEKCQKILEKMLSGINLIFKDYECYEELINMLFDENINRKCLDMNSVLNWEDLQNMFKQILKKTDLNADLKLKLDMNNIRNYINKSNVNITKDCEFVNDVKQIKKIIENDEKIAEISI